MFHHTSHLFRCCRCDELFHFRGCPQSCVAGHEGHAARVGTDVNRSEIGVSGNHSDPRQRTSQHFRRDLRGHRVRALADFRRAGVDDDTAIAINLDVDRGMRHVRTDDGVGRAADIVTASDAKPSSLGQFALALLPPGTLDRFFDTLGQSVALNSQAIDRDARRLEQVPLADLGRIHPDFCGQFVELRFLQSKTHTLTVPWPRMAPQAGLLVKTR